MYLWVQHLIALWRGDFNAIVGDFDKLYGKLEAHVEYKRRVAGVLAAKASVAQNASDAALADAAQAKKVSDNIGALLGK